MEYTPDFKHCFVDIYELAIYAEFEVRCLRAVKLLLQRLGHGQEIIMLYKQSNSYVNTLQQNVIDTQYIIQPLPGEKLNINWIKLSLSCAAMMRLNMT